MSSDHHRARWRYWPLLAFAVLMLSGSTWAAPAALGAAVAVSVLRGARAFAALRDASRLAGDAVVLGVDRAARPVTLSERQLSAHALVLGASGSGKSTTLLTILTQHIRRGSPVVAIDMKGSPTFARVLAEAAAAAGRPFRLWTPEGPEHWNPLAHGNATELKDKLIATERFTEPHYKRAAERYLQTVLQALNHAHPEAQPTLEEVVGMMDPRRLRATLRETPRHFSDRVRDYLAGLTADQLSAIRGLWTRLALLTESHTGRYLSGARAGQPGPARTVDLRGALRGDEVVLFSLNSSRYGQLAAQLGTLAVQDLVAAAGDRLSGSSSTSGERGHARAIIGIDEFSGLGGDHVIALLARCREAGMTNILATQELADLDRAAPGVRDQVVGNTAVKLVHRQEVPSSAETVAQMAGTRRVWEETRTIGGGLLRNRGARGTRRMVEEYVVHPNQLKTLATGEVVEIGKLPAARVTTVRVAPPRELAEPQARPAASAHVSYVDASSVEYRRQERPPREGRDGRTRRRERAPRHERERVPDGRGAQSPSRDGPELG